MENEKFRALKDYINNDMSKRNAYTYDELLSLMAIDYKSDWYLVDGIINSEMSPLDEPSINNIIGNIDPCDESLTFDLMYNVLKSLSVEFNFPSSNLCQYSLEKLMEIKELEHVYKKYGKFNISVVGCMGGTDGLARCVFNVNGIYLCQFKEVSSMIYDGKTFYYRKTRV